MSNPEVDNYVSNPDFVKLHDENVRLTRELKTQVEEHRRALDEVSRWRSESSRLHDEIARLSQNNITRQNAELRHDLTATDQKLQALKEIHAKEWKDHQKAREEVKRLRGEVDRLAHEAQEHFEALAAMPADVRLTAAELHMLNSSHVRQAREKIEADQRRAVEDARRHGERQAFLLHEAMKDIEHFRLRNKRLHDRVLELVRENRNLYRALQPPMIRGMALESVREIPPPGGCAYADEPSLGGRPVREFRLPDANQEGHE